MKRDVDVVETLDQDNKVGIPFSILIDRKEHNFNQVAYEVN